MSKAKNPSPVDYVVQVNVLRWSDVRNSVGKALAVGKDVKPVVSIQAPVWRDDKGQKMATVDVHGINGHEVARILRTIGEVLSSIGDGQFSASEVDEKVFLSPVGGD